MRPLAPVSVVIPCFRCGATLPNAIASVAHQTLRPAEVILVDDGNDAEAEAALKAIASRYPDWIRLVRLSSNAGAGAARNAGWAIAKQPWIAFLDADDSWHPEKMRLQYDYMSRHSEVALCGHRLEVSPRHAVPDTIALGDVDASVIPARSFLIRNAFSTPTVMLRREITFRFDDHRRHAEDLFLWQQIAFSGLKVVRLEVVLAFAHKPLYGASGLSAHLWRMEAAELANIRALYRRRSIGVVLFAGSSALSLLKYAVRLVRVQIRRPIMAEQA